MDTPTRCPECGTPDPEPMRCIACDATETETNVKTYPVRLIDGRPMCYACYYSGRGYSAIHVDLIDECRRLGVDMNVWQTGGGCQNFGVVVDANYPNEYGTSVLLGDASYTDGEPDQLGVCIDFAGDYAEEWTHAIDQRHPAPPADDTRTVQDIAQWMHRVVTDIRTDIALMKYGEELRQRLTNETSS